MALLQAMASGRPSVVTRVGGHAFLIEHGRTGLLVEPADIRGLADALSHLVKDRQLQADMGAEARREAMERFHVSRMAERTIAVYRQVLNNRWPVGASVG